MNLAFFDIAGTLVRGNPWLDVMRDPAIPRNVIRRQRIPVMVWYFAKKLRIISDTQFRHYWLHEVAVLLKRMSRTEIESIMMDAIKYQEAQGTFQDDVVERLQYHKAQGDHIVLVSGMFDIYVQQYARYFEVDGAIGSPLAFDGDTCTGTLSGPTCNGPRKLEFIQEYVRNMDVDADPKGGFAYADSYSDLPLLEFVGNPTATYPEAELHEIARSRDWTILGTAQAER